jgi:hypothetical protein
LDVYGISTIGGDCVKLNSLALCMIAYRDFQILYSAIFIK